MTNQQDKTIVNIYAPNIRVPKYIKQILRVLKGGIDYNTIIVGDFNTPVSAKDKLSREKINKGRLDMNPISEAIDIIDIYKSSHPTAAYTFFSSPHETFSTIDHTRATKTS